jgi:hypothetical protein
MGTAVMEPEVSNEIDILGNGVILENEENISENESMFERLARQLRLEGHDVVLVEEDDDDLDIDKYLSEKTRKYLELMELGKL